MVTEIDPDALQSKIAEGEDLELVDIRTPGEIAGGVIPAAKHLPMHLIPVRMHDLPKDRELILYCRSGARSYHACAYLMQQGFHRVVNLRGGIIGWARNGLEIASGLAVEKA